MGDESLHIRIHEIAVLCGKKENSEPRPASDLAYIRARLFLLMDVAATAVKKFNYYKALARAGQVVFAVIAGLALFLDARVVIVIVAAVAMVLSAFLDWGKQRD